MLLLQADGVEIRQRLIVLTQGKDGPRVVQVWERAWPSAGGSGGAAFVISRLPRGTYSDAQRTRSVVTSLDGILLEAIEKGATMYYWAGGAFRSLEVQI